MKADLDYALNNPETTQFWVEFALTKGNPLHNDYAGRMEYVDITLAQAAKIAQANCTGIRLEYQGQEYTKDWNDKPLGKLNRHTVRLWCLKAWQAMNQRHELYEKRRDEAEAKRKLITKQVVDHLFSMAPPDSEVDLAGIAEEVEAWDYKDIKRYHKTLLA